MFISLIRRFIINFAPPSPVNEVLPIATIERGAQGKTNDRLIFPENLTWFPTTISVGPINTTRLVQPRRMKSDPILWSAVGPECHVQNENQKGPEPWRNSKVRALHGQRNQHGRSRFHHGLSVTIRPTAVVFIVSVARRLRRRFRPTTGMKKKTEKKRSRRWWSRNRLRRRFPFGYSLF